ncbi:MAG: hypothetical protein PHS51_14485 [Gallionella sp.]|nr:hypothetical protein [Gallionella sp.]
MNKALIARLEAAMWRAARSAPPDDAREGDWLRAQLDRIEHSGGFLEASGPVVWVPRWMVRELTLARLAGLGEPPEPTGLVADKAFFDDLSGNL